MKKLKTEHSGSKKGRGAWWGPRKDAKKFSRRQRRENSKHLIRRALKEVN